MALISNDGIAMVDARGEVSEPVSLRPVEVVSVHASIYNRFTKNHCIEGFMSYQKAREVCSLDDLAVNYLIAQEINSFFDNWLVSNPDFSYKYIDDVFRTSISPAEEREYGQVISFHAKQSHVMDTVKAYLTPKAYQKEKGVEGCSDYYCEETLAGGLISKCEKDALTYRVVAYQSSIYIVVEEGFLEQMEDKTSKLKFISDILKAAYAVMPINTVNQSQWYAIYLDALRVSSPK